MRVRRRWRAGSLVPWTEARHLLVQVSTGTGKSLAYLVPAVAHATAAEKPVLVSTATLALQAQIMGRDLPRLLESLEPELERPVNVALVKGRANYLCKQKLAGGFPEDDDDAEALFSVAAEPSGSHRLRADLEARQAGRDAA